MNLYKKYVEQVVGEGNPQALARVSYKIGQWTVILRLSLSLSLSLSLTPSLSLSLSLSLTPRPNPDSNPKTKPLVADRSPYIKSADSSALTLTRMLMLIPKPTLTLTEQLLLAFDCLLAIRKYRVPAHTPSRSPHPNHPYP